VERLITTYQLNTQGIPDPSYLDVTTLRTLAYLRFSTRQRFALKFPRHKLADDGTQFSPGQAVATPSSLRLEYLALFRDWEFAGLVEGFEQFKDDLLVERDAGDPNRVNAQLPPDLINQLRVQATQIQFRL
jgi:phage tail sheath gpL-like